MPDGKAFRLKDFCNVVKRGHRLEFAGFELREKGIRIVQWAPEPAIDLTVHMPDGRRITGKAEQALGSVDGTVQLERFGYARVLGIEGAGVLPAQVTSVLWLPHVLGKTPEKDHVTHRLYPPVRHGDRDSILH